MFRFLNSDIIHTVRGRGKQRQRLWTLEPGHRPSVPGSATALLCDLANPPNHSVPLFPHLLSQFSCSAMSDSVTPWTAARQASLSITNSRIKWKLYNCALALLRPGWMWIHEKQRHYFANKGPSSQGNDFSCGHVWM